MLLHDIHERRLFLHFSTRLYFSGVQLLIFFRMIVMPLLQGRGTAEIGMGGSSAWSDDDGEKTSGRQHGSKPVGRKSSSSSADKKAKQQVKAARRSAHGEFVDIHAGLAIGPYCQWVRSITRMNRFMNQFVHIQVVRFTWQEEHLARFGIDSQYSHGLV